MLVVEFCHDELVSEKTGEIKLVPKKTKELSTEEFSAYIERVKQWAAEFLGCVLPDAGDQLEIQTE